MMRDEFEMYDAAYVLGALSPQERSDFEQHMADCASCREAVRSLAGMPGLLAGTDPEPTSEEPPPTLWPRLARTVRRNRLRRRYGVGALAAAAAAALIAVVVLAAGSGDSPSTTQARVAMTQTVPSPITARARISSADWGTRIDVRCTYAAGSGYSPRTYLLVVRDATGHWQKVATWLAVPGQDSTVDGLTPLHRDDLTAVQIRSQNNQPLLQLRL